MALWRRKSVTFRLTRAPLLMAALAVPTLLAACATEQERVQDKEDNLAAAGFAAKPANSPERQAEMARLPPHHFVMRPVGDRYVYLYSDPLVCGCLYVGSQEAYGKYKQMMIQQRLADQAQMTAQMYSDPAWNWGPWGGWGPGFGRGFGPGFY